MIQTVYDLLRGFTTGYRVNSTILGSRWPTCNQQIPIPDLPSLRWEKRQKCRTHPDILDVSLGQTSIIQQYT